MVLLDLILPRLCPVCDGLLLRREKFICLECYTDLPMTYFWKWKDNPAEEIFWGRLYDVPVVSLFYYREGSPYKKIIHNFKYLGNRKLGIFFGEILGSKISEGGRFNTVDCVLAVPLHSRKKWKRGYNQAFIIAKAISTIIDKPIIEGVLKRKRFTKTQTKKKPEARWENVLDAFKLVDKEKIAGKHVLLVDDVLTTGATLEACGRHILDIEGCKLSIATLAFVE